MNLTWIDWAILVVAVVGLRVVSVSTRHYMKGVADFLSANRCAGRYLLTIASQMGNTGAVTFIAVFEMSYAAGLAPGWWTLMYIPVGTIILLTGWVFYRFRETRALTMAQFFEMRYSRRFRIFAGSLCWLTGIINFGIFPAVAARFFIYFCGLPEHFHIPGLPWELSTFATIMFVDLGLALSFVNMGGQISVMITECVQGMISCLAFLIISVAIILRIHWPQVVEALSQAPADASMLNPFHTSQVKDFNLWYYLIAIFGTFYGYMSWQGGQGFYSSARTPHEQKMAGIIGNWRQTPQWLAISLLSLAALVVMRLPEYSSMAATINETLQRIPNESIRSEMQVPVAMAHLLPTGVKGLLAMVFLFFSFTCHDTYMHSWGSIFVQDIYMPFVNKPLSQEQHIRILRWSITFVAVFAFVFSLLYKPTQEIVFFFAITGTIWMAGSGAVIIGGLYWNRGTTAGAFWALVVGAIVGVSGLTWPPLYKEYYGAEFPINGQWISLIGMLSAALVYWLVSLMTSRGREPANMERILHRGRYAVDAGIQHFKEPQSLWLKIVGINDEFSRRDKILAVTLVLWNVAWFAFFIIFTLVNLVWEISDAAWSRYFHISILMNLIISIPVVVWFTIGGLIDIKALFTTLKTAVRDAADDGRVSPVSDPAESEESHWIRESAKP